MIGRLLSVGGFTALSRLAGFFRDILMAAILGAGPMSDAFMVAFRLPNNFRAIFAEGAFNAAFLPRYTAAATKAGTAPTSAATSFADDVFSWQVFVQLVLLVLALAFMRGIVAVLAPGFADNPDQMHLAVVLSRITFPYLLCITIVTQISAMLNGIGKFRAAAASPILLNIAMIGTLLAAAYFPSAAHAAAYGVLIAGILQLLYMVRAGAKSFSERGCVHCHGGPGVDWSKFSEGLNPGPPDLKDVVGDMLPQELFWVIRNGIKMTGMPSFGAIEVPDQEIWSIVSFLKKLPSVSDADFKAWSEAAPGASRP